MKFNTIVSVPLGLAGASVGFGLAGKAFNSPGLTSAGTTTSQFISPAVSIGVGGSLIREVKKLKGGLKE